MWTAGITLVLYEKIKSLLISTNTAMEGLGDVISFL